MADVATAVRAYLLSKTPISDLISQRMYRNVLKQSSPMPAAVITRLFTTHEYDLHGFAGLAHARFQLECYGGDAVVADELAEAIRSSGIVGFQGVTGGVDIRGARVVEGMSDEVNPPTDGSDKSRFVTVLDLEIDYTET